MQPVVHLAVGYLAYAGYARWRQDALPDEVPTLAALVGAALPDLLDKPPWLLGVVDVGRTIGHSLLFGVPLLAGVLLVARSRADSRATTLGVAFAIGYCSHIATDIPWHVIAGDFDELGFLLWPLTPMPAYTGTKPLGTVPGLEATVTTLWFEAIAFVAGVACWWIDSRPGLAAVRGRDGNAG